MKPGTASVTTSNAGAIGSTGVASPFRRLARRAASEGCMVHSTGSDITPNPVETLYHENKKANC
jgi:hypothetical protein